MTEERFVKIVEDDMQRIGHWVTLQSESLHAKLGLLLTSCSDESYPIDYLRGERQQARLQRERPADSRPAEQADELGRMACELDKLILLNYEGFLKIAKKHDKWIGLSTRPWMLARLSTASFFHERFDKIVSGLSDAYDMLRLREHPEIKVVWAPPSEFNRATTKYWVKPEDVLLVKCAMIKEIPVLFFGREPTVGAVDGSNQPSDSSLITSVYLDNDSLDIYHTRLDREDGATLFRFRWYGPRSGPNQSVYVERKTHMGPEKKKAGLLSVKERFMVKWSDISDLLSGKMDLTKRVEEPLRAAGESEEAVAYAMNLANECQLEIAARRLQPVVTTVYYRTAFQLSSSNNVRSTFDSQLRMVDETATRTSLGEDEWYRPLNNELIKDVHEFPYSVLEIKLQGDAPEWVTRLIESGKIIKCYKFSKYLHSIVVLGHPVHKPPHWFGDNSVFLLLPLGRQGTSNSSSSGPPSVAGSAQQPSPALMARNADMAEMGGMGTLMLGKDAAKGMPARAMYSDLGGSSTDGGGTSVAPDSIGTGSTGTGGGSANSSDEKKDKKEKKRKEQEKLLRDAAREKKEKEKEEKKEKGSDIEKGCAPRVKTLVRKRVDPKTLFANERTMLQWLNMAVLLVFTSLALLAASTAVIASGSTTTNTKAVAGGAQLCGAILAPAAVVVMFYAMWQYYWRISRITDPDEDARFEDKFGPLVLVAMIIIVCSVAIVISINRFSWGSFDVRDHDKKKDGGVASSSGAMPLALAASAISQQQSQQQVLAAQPQPIPFGDPKTSLMLRQTDSGVRLGLLSWSIAGFCCATVVLVLTRSQLPVFVVFRRNFGKQLHHHEQAMEVNEEEGLLGGSKEAASWGKQAVGDCGPSYGSAKPSDVPLFDNAIVVSASADTSGGAFRRLPHGSAAERRWELKVATMLPEGRSRMRASPIPFAIAI